MVRVSVLLETLLALRPHAREPVLGGKMNKRGKSEFKKEGES
jgi:hypothetical protein